MGIRRATTDDLPWIMSLCELDRIHKNDLHPIDHREPASYCRTRRREMERLLEDPSSICLIREHHGQPQAFLMARLMEAPPVYAPGGPVCLVEEFEVVRPQDLPTCGAQLLDEARGIAKRRGAVLQRVVSAAGDTARERFLQGSGFTVASEWYYGPTDKVRHPPPASGKIRRAVPGDIPIIFSMGENKRRQYEEYQPVFWRAAAPSIEAVAPWLNSQIEGEGNIALVHESRGNIDGFVIAARGSVDDFCVTPAQAWPVVGAALLSEASRRAAEIGTDHFLIVCAHLDQPERSTVAELGFELITNWYVRNF